MVNFSYSFLLQFVPYTMVRTMELICCHPFTTFIFTQLRWTGKKVLATQKSMGRQFIRRSNRVRLITKCSHFGIENISVNSININEYNSLFAHTHTYARLYIDLFILHTFIFPNNKLIYKIDRRVFCGFCSLLWVRVIMWVCKCVIRSTTLIIWIFLSCRSNVRPTFIHCTAAYWRWRWWWWWYLHTNTNRNIST